MLAAAMAIQDEGRRLNVWFALLPYLSGGQQETTLQQVLAVAMAIQNTGKRTDTLIALLPHLSGEPKEELIRQLLTLAETIQDEEWRADILVALLPHLSGEPKEELIRQVLAVAVAKQEEGRRADILIALLSYVGGELKEATLRQILAAIAAIQNEGRRVDVLRALLPHFSTEEMRRQALALAVAIQNKGRRALFLHTLLPHLSNEEALQQALAAAGAIVHKETVIEHLKVLLPQLNHWLKAQVIAQLIESALVCDEAVRTNTLIWLRPYLAEFPVSNYCHVLKGVQDEWLRTNLVSMTLPHLDIAAQRAVTQVLPHIPDQLNRRQIMQIILNHPERSTLDQAIQAAIAIRDNLDRVKIYAALAEWLRTETKGLISDKIKQELNELDSPTDLITTQLHLAHCHEGAQRAQLRAKAIEFSVAISNNTERTRALLKLLSYLDPDEKIPVVEQLLHTLRAIRDIEELSRTIYLIMQNDNFTPKQEIADIAFAYVMDTKEMANIDPDYALNIDNLDVRVELLCMAVPFLEPIFQRIAIRQVLHEVQYIDGAEPRAHALTALLPYVHGTEHTTLFYRLLSTVHAIDDVLTRFALLVKAASADRGRRAFTEAKSIALTLADPKARAEAMVALLPLADPLEKHLLLCKGLKATLQLTKQTERAPTLAQYIPYVKNVQPIIEDLCFALIQNIRAQARTTKRADLLDYLANEPLFRSARLPEAFVLTIAQSISEICNDWVWL